MRNLVLFSRFVGPNVTGHFDTFYASLLQQEDPRFEVSLIGGQGTPFAGSSGIFSPHMSQYGHKSRKLTKQLLSRGLMTRLGEFSRPCLFVFYDGDLPDFWLAWRLAEKDPNTPIVFNLHLAHLWAERLSRGGQSRAFVRALRSKPPNLHFWVESERLSSYLEPIIGLRLPTFPVFTAFGSHEFPRQESRTVDAVIVLADERSAAWAANFVRSLDAMGERRQIVFTGPAEPESVGQPGVTYLSPDLSSDDYVALVRSAKTVILPYFSDFHHWGSSGRLEDAIFFGSRPIPPANSALAERLMSNKSGYRQLDLLSPGFARSWLDLLSEDWEPPTPVLPRKLFDLLDNLVPPDSSTGGTRYRRSNHRVALRLVTSKAPGRRKKVAHLLRKITSSLRRVVSRVRIVP